MNINGNNPSLNYDSGCPQTGNWKMTAGAANNYVSGAPSGSSGGCAGFPAGGPGYVLLRVNRATNALTMEVRDTNNVVRRNTTLNLPLTLTKTVGTD